MTGILTFIQGCELAMALWVCLDCGTVYAVGLEACPQCGYRKHREDWEEPAPAPKPGKGARGASVEKAAG